MLTRLVSCILLMTLLGPVHAKGKIGGYAGGAVAWRAGEESKVWLSGSYRGWYELSLEPGEYVVTLDWKYAPRIPVYEGQTTILDGTDEPRITMEMDVWGPACFSYGQTYTATGTELQSVAFRMFGGSTRLKLTVREGGPEGRLMGEITLPDRRQGDTVFNASPGQFPTAVGKSYYVEIASTEGIAWNISMPRSPDPYPGGMAYYDGVCHPESDLGISIVERKPGLVKFASAEVDQHFIEKGPGSGFCRVAGQTFVPGECKNIVSVYANVGFDGLMQDFVYTIYEGGPNGKPLISRQVRVRTDWGATAYFQPDEVALKPGMEYYLEYKRVDGGLFYSYLSADVYPQGKAYRDGKEVEGFDQFFRIEGEVEPGGATYPFNIKISGLTSTEAVISWQTGTSADGLIHFGEDSQTKQTLAANSEPSNTHRATLTGLKPSTVYYYRVSSCTNKQWAGRTYGRLSTFMTLPEGEDKPKFDHPEQSLPVSIVSKANVQVANGSFEEGLTGWRVCWSSNPREPGDYRMPPGPYGRVTANDDGYKPHSGMGMYGWRHLKVEDPKSPIEVWKQDLIHQRVRVIPGHKYILKAWVITADRESSWGADCRIRLLVDTKNAGFLNQIDTSGQALATQWFATQGEWKQVFLNFTAEDDMVDIGVQFLEWFVHEACYLYVDDVNVEEIADGGTNC
ncbi:MAG: fibronectin type III domain-containing protein [Armatimonadota bacterium]